MEARRPFQFTLGSLFSLTTLAALLTFAAPSILFQACALLFVIGVAIPGAMLWTIDRGYDVWLETQHRRRAQRRRTRKGP